MLLGPLAEVLAPLLALAADVPPLVEVEPVDLGPDAAGVIDAAGALPGVDASAARAGGDPLTVGVSVVAVVCVGATGFSVGDAVC